MDVTYFFVLIEILFPTIPHKEPYLLSPIALVIGNFLSSLRVIKLLAKSFEEKADEQTIDNK